MSQWLLLLITHVFFWQSKYKITFQQNSIFRGGLLLLFNIKKNAKEAHPLLSAAYPEYAPEFEYVSSGLQDLKVVILTQKTKSDQKSLKTKNWKYYLIKLHVKLKKNLEKHGKSLNKPFLTV